MLGPAHVVLGRNNHTHARTHTHAHTHTHTHTHTQTTLLACCSDEEVAKYFTAVFKRLTEDKPPQVGQSVVVYVLQTKCGSVCITANEYVS